MKIEHEHNLTMGQSYDRIDNLLVDLQREYAKDISNPQSSWNSGFTRMDYSIEVRGLSTEGYVALDEGKVTLELKIPFAAKMFSGKIERKIRATLEETLADH